MIEHHFLGLYITNTCNRNCVFCFKRHGYPRPMHISLEDLSVFCVWAAENNVGTLKLAGGEPTTHPEFHACLQMIRERLTVSRHIITNLMCEDRTKIAAMADFGILANGNFLDSSDHDLFCRNVEILRSLGSSPSISLTLWSLGQNEEPLLSCCRNLGIEHVRLDVSRASILKRNQHVTLDQLGPFKEKLLSLARKLIAQGVKIGFDCPLPTGMFTEKELRELDPDRACWMDPAANVCAHLYVNPDLSISACPHQVLLSKRLDAFADFYALRQAVGDERHRLLVRQYHRTGNVGSCLCDAERYISRAGRSRTGTTPAPEAGGLPSSPQPDQSE